MPREDCTLVMGKSVYTFTVHQEHIIVSGRKSYALTLLSIGNDLGRSPGYGISSSPTTGAMVELFVFVGFLLAYCNNLCSSLYGLLVGKIILKIQLVENKEVTLLVELNW